MQKSESGMCSCSLQRINLHRSSRPSYRRCRNPGVDDDQAADAPLVQGQRLLPETAEIPGGDLFAGFEPLDLHRHLDGAIRLETVLELAQEKGIELPAKDLESLRPHVVVEGKADGLMDFIGRFRWLTAILTDLDACRRVAYENVEDARDEGIDYVELRFSPIFMAETHGLDVEGVIAAVADGIKAAERDTGVRAQMIGIMSRTYDTETCHHELDALLAHRDHLVAIDLASGEHLWSVPMGTSRDLAPFPFWWIKGLPGLSAPMVTTTVITAIQDNGGKSCTAAEPCPNIRPLESRLVAASSGHSSIQAMPRVSS